NHVLSTSYSILIVGRTTSCNLPSFGAYYYKQRSFVKRFKVLICSRLESRYLQAMAVGLGLPATAFWVDQHVHNWSPSWKMLPADMFIGVVNPIGYGMTLLVVTMALWALGWCAKRP